jgi:hypothetical protein
VNPERLVHIGELYEFRGRWGMDAETQLAVVVTLSLDIREDAFGTIMRTIFAGYHYERTYAADVNIELNARTLTVIIGEGERNE